MTAYHGRILATPLVDTAQEVLGHSYIGPSYRIDPHKLKPGAGSLRYRPEGNKSQKDTATNSPSHDYQESLEREYSGVRLDVFLYESEQFGLSGDVGTAIHLELNRQADEPAVRSLQRLGLNIQKKYSQQQKQEKAKKRVSPVDPLVWTTIPESNEKTLLDVSEMTNVDLCRKSVASESSICVELSFNGLGEGQGVTQLSLSYEAFVPTVGSVKTFDDFNARLFVGIPLTVSVETLYASHSQVEWYIDSVMEETTVQRKGIHTYIPTDCQLGKRITIMVKPLFIENGDVHHDGAGAEQAFRFEGQVEARPDNTILNLRKGWLDLKRKSGFRFLTYNILADQNAFSMTDGAPFYPYVSKETLEKRRRMPLILHEIITYNADIICLQEVDEAVFQSLFQPAFTSLGFQGFYSGKVKDGTREGCAMFWSLSKFLPVDNNKQLSFPIRDLVALVDDPSQVESSNYHSDASIRRLLRDSPNLQNTLTQRLGHVVQLVRLQCRDEAKSRALWVANTHLFYHPIASHIRLIQAYLLSRKVGIYMSEDPGDLIVTGDFNSSLRNAAGKLLLDRSVPQNFRDTLIDFSSFRWEKEDASEAVDLANGMDRRPIDFPSIAVGDDFPSLHSAITPEPEFTHLVDGFCGALDHVLMSNAIQCLSYAPMPEKSDVTTKVAMPSPEIPSDHVCIICDIKHVP